MSEHDAQLSSLLPPAPPIAASVLPSQDVKASVALLGTVVDELSESVRALRRAVSDENVDLRARIHELEARLARLEAAEHAVPVAAPAPAVDPGEAPRAKLAKRARRQAKLAAAGEASAQAAPPAKEVRAKIARQLKNDHRRLSDDDES